MKRRGFLLASTSGLAATIGGAHAADMGVPAKAPPPQPVPYADWTGFYIGGNIGTAWQQVNVNGENQCCQNNRTDSQSSFIGGGQIGYNWQHGNFVYGLEADMSGLTHGPRIPNVDGKANNILESDTRWLATFRTRTGLAVNDTLVYMTGGLAVGNVRNFFAARGTINPVAIKSESSTRAGWVAGGGIEHMWDAHWTIGVDALFVDLGNRTARSGKTSKNQQVKFKNQAIISRFKVNYKF